MSFIKKQQIEHPEMTMPELKKHCSKNYPFHQRSGWAYKAWLSAMKDVFGRTKKAPAPPGQGDLYE